MDNICFVDHLFITTHPLSPDNIMEYFSTSPFYDKSSTNEILKMQNQYRGINTVQDVTKYKGMYYILEYSTPDNLLFVIRQSTNYKDTINIGYYYVIHGHIYKAFTDHKIYKTRVNDIYWYLNEILDYYFIELSKKEETTEIKDKESIPDDVLRDVNMKFNKLYK